MANIHTDTDASLPLLHHHPRLHMSVHTAYTYTEAELAHIGNGKALLLWLPLHISETRLPRCRSHSLSPGFVVLL